MENFKKLSEIGYTRVQVSTMNDIPAKAIKAASEVNNIKVPGDHYVFNRMLDDINAVIERHKVFACMNFGNG